MDAERCPTCAGPVEIRTIPLGIEGIPTEYPRALPDTLEGICEAAKDAAVTVREVDGVPTSVLMYGASEGVLHKALVRLFKGCATCGREPFVSPETHAAVWKMSGTVAATAKRQAYQQAAEMVAEYIGRGESSLEANLRKLAEGT